LRASCTRSCHGCTIATLLRTSRTCSIGLPTCFMWAHALSFMFWDFQKHRSSGCFNGSQTPSWSIYAISYF
jgi:hypothetical protein